MASPIADLSYRNYDGPLMPPVNRWWAIARMSILLAMRKKVLWFFAVGSAIWYLLLLVILYITDLVAASTPGGNPILKSLVWKDQILNGFSVSQMGLAIIALIIGVGTISNDTRANALLVYLSKPCSKMDYLVGKWVGLFIPFFVISFVPALAFYGYGVMTYQAYGFVTQDPWLVPKLALMATIPGFVHASLCLGISSLFNQGRLAGATYAGIYFMSLFFTKAMQFIAMGTQARSEGVPSIVDKLYYCSIDGIQIGLAKIVLHTNGSGLLSAAIPLRGPHPVPAPSAAFILPLALVPCILGLVIAWNRVRAVEVVG